MALPKKMAHMNSASYDRLRCVSRGKFSIQQFLRLKELAVNTVGVNNSIFDIELNSLLTLYNSLCREIKILETEITRLIQEVKPHYMSIPGIGPIQQLLFTLNIFLFHLKYDIFRWSIKATLFCHTNFFQKTLDYL